MSDDLILADAIYAAGQALHADACTEGDPHDGCDCGDWDREAEIAVRAALPSIEHQLRELIAQEAERAERHGYDLDPHDLLAALDGGE